MKEYVAQQQLISLQAGINPAASLNEKLISVARESKINREQPRLKLPTNEIQPKSADVEIVTIK